MSLQGHRVSAPPFACNDGRIFDVVNIVVAEGQGASYQLLCTVEVMEREAEQPLLEFAFYFYREAFQNGLCRPEPKSLIEYALPWLEEWLDNHPVVPSYYRSGHPVIVECR